MAADLVRTMDGQLKTRHGEENHGSLMSVNVRGGEEGRTPGEVGGLIGDVTVISREPREAESRDSSCAPGRITWMSVSWMSRAEGGEHPVCATKAGTYNCLGGSMDKYGASCDECDDRGCHA